MKHLLVVTHYFAEHGGGVEIIAGELAGRLARRGFRITWAATGDPRTAPPAGVSFLPLKAWNFTERWLGIPYPVVGLISLIRLMLAVRACDLLHLHDSLYLANVVAFASARLFGKPIVVTQHIGLVPYSSRLCRWLMGAANSILARWVLAGSDAVVLYSHKVLHYFGSWVSFCRAPRFIANGVATALFHPVSLDDRAKLRRELGWPADQPVMLFVGRFVEKKGLPILRDLAERFPRWRWVFVGWGPRNPDRWALANVTCLGQRQSAEIARCYRAADLLVLPSVGEGFPLVVQEAMACGTPVLISEDTARGEPGVESVAWTCDLQVEAFARQIQEIVSAPAALSERGRRSAEYARRHWDWDESAHRYKGLFDELLTTASREALESANSTPLRRIVKATTQAPAPQKLAHR